MTTKEAILIVILGILFLIRANLDRIELMEDLEEMNRYEEEDEQRENEHTRATSEDKR